MLAWDRIGSSIDMTKRQQILKSLEDREYRREFAADIGTGLAFQIRLLRENRGWIQEQLADRMGKRQETISQWENPDYGRYTLNTLRELAAAFDVALLVRFAPFSELVDWSINLTPERLAPPSFDEELLYASARQTVPREGAVETLFLPADMRSSTSDLGVVTGSKEGEKTHAAA